MHRAIWCPKTFNSCTLFPAAVYPTPPHSPWHYWNLHWCFERPPLCSHCPHLWQSGFFSQNPILCKYLHFWTLCHLSQPLACYGCPFPVITHNFLWLSRAVQLQRSTNFLLKPTCNVNSMSHSHPQPISVPLLGLGDESCWGSCKWESWHSFLLGRLWSLPQVSDLHVPRLDFKCLIKRALTNARKRQWLATANNKFRAISDSVRPLPTPQAQTVLRKLPCVAFTLSPSLSTTLSLRSLPFLKIVLRCLA